MGTKQRRFRERSRWAEASALTGHVPAGKDTVGFVDRHPANAHRWFLTAYASSSGEQTLGVSLGLVMWA